MASRRTRLRLNHHRILKTQTSQLCVSGKIQYVSREEAFAAVEPSMLAGMVKPCCHLKPYKCDLCTAWHLANTVVNFKPEGA